MASATSSTFDSPQLPNLTPDPLPPHFPPLPQQMSRSPSLKPQDSRPSEQSQPMTRNASTSSSSSTKNQDASDSAPYGTRSRSGAGTRPNYADDNELDSAIMSLREDGFSNGKPSTSPEGATKSAGEASQPRGPSTTIKLNIKSGNFPHASQNGFFAANSDQHPRSDGAGPPQPERKKRKYERHQPAKNQAARDSQNGAAAAAATSRDAIPGASQFSAMPNGASEAPPWKRRKTSDGQSHVPYPSARTSSLGHPANQEPRESALVTFESSGYFLKNGELQADNGRSYAPNDHVYLICEPPGDPYYLARIMEFKHADPTNSKSPVVSMLINWFYRPRDISRMSNDARFLYATMQSDESPISSLRGKCVIRHRTEIKDLDEYRKQRDAFWFNQLYDRYSHRPYEIIPSSAVINVPEKVKKVLDERWQFLVVEQTRQKELTSAVKLCKRCSLYCAPNDSVDCGVCRDTYHMACVRPPLSKKPSRGFAWSCGPCSRAQEKKLEQRHSALVAPSAKEGEEDFHEEEEEEGGGAIAALAESEEPEPEGIEGLQPAQSDTAHADMWPWRYLGIHCRVEDVLQYDDRAIYPRASSRLGAKHQANVIAWYGRPIEYEVPSEMRKKLLKGVNHKKDSKMSKETAAALEREKVARAQRPKHIQDLPTGYVARGEDYDEGDPSCTATPIFVKPPDIPRPRSSFAAANASIDSTDKVLDEYMTMARGLAKDWGLVTMSQKGDPQISTNFLDQALRLISKHNFNKSAALDALKLAHTPRDLGNPDFTKEEIKKFEDAIVKYGTDMRAVRKHVKTRNHGEVVRFYYTWKSTARGLEVRRQRQGRAGTKKRAESSWTEIADEDDDSAFDNGKAHLRKRRFQCKHCHTRSSRQWRRAPHVAPGATVAADPKSNARDKSNLLIVALCLRCAVLWRKYAMGWFDPDEVAKPINQSGGRAWKRRNDEELLRELVCANEAARVPSSQAVATAAASIGIQVTFTVEAAKKKAKAVGEKESTPSTSASEAQKKTPAPPPPRPATPPIDPAPPKWRTLPCAVCRYLESAEDELVTCKECKLTVHRRCYAIPEQTNANKWVCDTCMNDKNPQYSLRYECALCPVANRTTELLEPPKVSHKKKTDRDREKERLERELVQKEEESYFKSQKRRGRPMFPREALKLTASNNWAHITCAVWTPEIKFSDSKKMQAAEGMGAVVASPSRMDAICKLCKLQEGVCVTCHQCHAPFHVACAHDAGYAFGFDMSPVKGSRKDLVHSVTLGAETGTMSAAIWCREHSIKTIVHDITEVVEPESGMNALQLYCQSYKQADLTLTGTARKANLLGQPARPSAQMSPPSHNRRSSTTLNGSVPHRARKSPPLNTPHLHHAGDMTNGTTAPSPDDKRCATCDIDTSLRWHPYRRSAPPLGQVNGVGPGYAGSNAWQCHKCSMRNTTESERTELTNRNKTLSTEARNYQPDLFELTAPSVPATVSRSGKPLPPVGSPERFGEELKDLRIILNNPKHGGFHVFEGSDFGLHLESDPTPAYRYFVWWAQHDCKYLTERDVIIAEDGSWVTFPRSFTQALAKSLWSNRREAHWQIVNATTVDCIPMKLPANIPHMDRLKSGSIMRHPSFTEPPPIPPAQLPPLPPIPAGMTAFFPASNTQHLITPSSIYRTSGTEPTPRAQLPAGGPPPPYYISHGSSMNIARRSTGSPDHGGARPATPREASAGSGVGGASSSPNLRNLMH